MHGSAVTKVANKRHDYLVKPSYLFLDRVDVQQRLRRVLARSVPSIDHGYDRCRSELSCRATFWMPDHDHIDISRDDACRVAEGFPLRHRREGHTCRVEDRAPKALERRSEAKSRAGARLEEEIAKKSPFQHSYLLAPCGGILHA